VVSPGGYAVLTMTARGVAIEVLRDLVRMGLATAQRKTFGRRNTKVAYVRITETGRQTIAD
jgi:DNA-binding PadR family transcriptional regulator